MDLEPDIIAAMHAGDWQKVAALERLFEAAFPPPVPIVSAALWYASVGLKVFPLQPNTKMPHRGSRGLLDATTDPELIQVWWQIHPDSNVAIATGHLVDVIDIDGPVGVKSWADNLDMIDELTHLGHVSTPRAGGTHIYIPASPVRTNKAGLLPGIDVRAAGGYVVAPPSRIDTKTYYWRTPLNLKP